MERVKENEGYLRLIAKTELKRGRRLITEAIRQLASRYLGPRVRKRLMLRYLPIIKKILAVAVPLYTILASVAQLT